MLWSVIGLFLALSALMGSLSDDLLTRANDNRNFVKSVAQQEIAQSMLQYRRENGTFPASGPALASKPGFSSLRTWLSTENGGLYPSGARDLAEIAVSNILDDGQWAYSRAVAFSVKDRTLPVATYLGPAQNTCAPPAGNTDFSRALSWCGSRQSTWTKYESREAYSEELTRGRSALIRTIGKFLSSYNAAQAFPDSGAETSLTVLAGGPATAAECTGDNRYSWSGIPLGCEDLFSWWGSPVRYRYENARKFSLLSTSAVLDNTGNAVVVSTEVEL